MGQLSVRRASPLQKNTAKGLLPPDTADAVEGMKHRLKTKAGKAIYAKRKSTIGPVFGIIKAGMGFRQFILLGLAAVTGEWELVCVAFNLKRLFALAK